MPNANDDDLYGPLKPHEQEALAKAAPMQSGDDDLYGPLKPHEQAQLGNNEPSFGDKVISGGLSVLDNTVGRLARAKDRVAGAPERAAIGAAQDIASNPSLAQGLLNVPKAYFSQLGHAADPLYKNEDQIQQAPTGKEIAQKAGVPNTALSDVAPGAYGWKADLGRVLPTLSMEKGGLLDPTLSGAAGEGINAAADITNLIPPVAAGKFAFKGLQKVGGLIGDVAKPAINYGGKAMQWLGKSNAPIQAAEEAAKAAPSTMSHVISSLTPKVNPEAGKWAAVATKNGIDPEILPSAIKYGEHSPITTAERAAAHGITGEQLATKTNEAFDAVDSALTNKIANHAGGIVPTSVDAGNAITEGAKAARNKLFEDNDLRYSNLYQIAPGLQVTNKEANALESVLSGAEKRAKGLMTHGSTEDEAVGRDLLNTVAKLRKNGTNVKQLSEALSYLGETAFKGRSEFKALTPDQKAYAGLYHGVSDALTGTASQFHPEIGKQLLESNKNITNFIQNAEPIQKALQNKNVAPETLVKLVTADSKRAQSIVNMLGPEELGVVKGHILDSLLSKNAESGINYASSLKALESKAPVLNKLFSPSELAEVKEVLELGNKMGGRPAKVLPITGNLADLRKIPEQALSGAVNNGLIQQMKNYANRGGGLLSETSNASVMPPKLGLLDQYKAMKNTRSNFDKALTGAKAVPGVIKDREQRRE